MVLVPLDRIALRQGRRPTRLGLHAVRDELRRANSRFPAGKHSEAEVVVVEPLFQRRVLQPRTTPTNYAMTSPPCASEIVSREPDFWIFEKPKLVAEMEMEELKFVIEVLKLEVVGKNVKEEIVAEIGEPKLEFLVEMEELEPGAVVFARLYAEDCRRLLAVVENITRARAGPGPEHRVVLPHLDPVPVASRIGLLFSRLLHSDFAFPPVPKIGNPQLF